MQELGFIKFSSENIPLSEGLLCQFSQSTEYLIFALNLKFLPGVLKVSSCRGTWFNPRRGRWQALTTIANLWLTISKTPDTLKHARYLLLVQYSLENFRVEMEWRPLNVRGKDCHLQTWFSQPNMLLSLDLRLRQNFWTKAFSKEHCETKVNRWWLNA